MTPRLDAAATLAILAGLALALVAAAVAVRVAVDKMRIPRCCVPGCSECGGSWRDSETQT